MIFLSSIEINKIVTDTCYVFCTKKIGPMYISVHLSSVLLSIFRNDPSFKRKNKSGHFWRLIHKKIFRVYQPKVSKNVFTKKKVFKCFVQHCFIPKTLHNLTMKYFDYWWLRFNHERTRFTNPQNRPWKMQSFKTINIKQILLFLYLIHLSL